MTAASLPVRVTLLNTWDERSFVLPGDTPVAEVKRLTLAGRGESPDGYLVKYQGAELAEGTTTLAQAGVQPNAALIVLSRRRTPVR
jgi:hypothetical protein